MKSADEVGNDFDEYAKAWPEQNYGLEVAFRPGRGLIRDADSAAVRLPGDEWGDARALRDDYALLVDKLALPPQVDVLEIGAGGGRSTEALLDVLGDRAGTYHVIDVSEAVVDILRSRVTRPLDIHVVSDVDVSMLEDCCVDLVLAQSSWSHISLYDQYRYLRDLRRVLKEGAPIVVSGLFLVGAGDPWTWNRFRRRVYQIDHGISGVYHEFTSISFVAEMLTRLGYEDIVVFAHGFVARRGQLVGDQHRARLPNGIRYAYQTSLETWLRTGATVRAYLPPTAPRPQPRLVRAARARLGRARRRVARLVRRPDGV